LPAAPVIATDCSCQVKTMAETKDWRLSGFLGFVLLLVLRPMRRKKIHQANET